jgi:hypothetical protein
MGQKEEWTISFWCCFHSSNGEFAANQKSKQRPSPIKPLRSHTVVERVQGGERPLCQHSCWKSPLPGFLVYRCFLGKRFVAAFTFSFDDDRSQSTSCPSFTSPKRANASRTAGRGTHWRLTQPSPVTLLHDDGPLRNSTVLSTSRRHSQTPWTRSRHGTLIVRALFPMCSLRRLGRCPLESSTLSPWDLSCDELQRRSGDTSITFSPFLVDRSQGFEPAPCRSFVHRNRQCGTPKNRQPLRPWSDNVLRLG